MSQYSTLFKKTCSGLFKIVSCACMFDVVTRYTVSYVTCTGQSMEPEIYNGDAYIVESISVRYQKLKRGDIIGFKALDKPESYCCKRIVGMAGDHVYNNLTKEYVLVPKGHVWCEGDNKENSIDSRVTGAIPYGLIFCRLAFKIMSGRSKDTLQTKTKR